jgi:protocatechuate 3,4-dioxygenase beta subunit
VTRLALLAMLLVACSSGGSAARAPASPAQPSAAAGSPSPAACTGRATPAETAGPFFKAGSPERTSLLEAGTAGTHLSLSGRVLTPDCRPVAGATLDFWQADTSGRYDTSGYRLRGHQLTDAEGRYTLDTIVPGEYTGRTEHIHVKVQAPGGAVLTTQLYFPGVARNSDDPLYDPALSVDLKDAGGGARTATFDFVVSV